MRSHFMAQLLKFIHIQMNGWNEQRMLQVITRYKYLSKNISYHRKQELLSSVMTLTKFQPNFFEQLLLSILFTNLHFILFILRCMAEA